jgi:hypothetical protein
MLRLVSVAATFAICVVAISCTESRGSSVQVERTDSAEVEIVTNRGEDVRLPWRLEPVLTFGGEDDGPMAFFNVWSFVRADAAGRIYLLDGGNHRVSVFDSEGRFIRSMGSRGGGPGEFEFGMGFSVDPDGTVSLFDPSKRGIMRWGPDGELLPTIPLDQDRFVLPHVISNGILVGEIVDITAGGTGRIREVHAIRDGGSTRLASIVVDGQAVRDDVQFDGCPVRLFGQEPVLAADFHLALADDGIHVSSQAEYEVRTVGFDGAVRRIVRRDLPVKRAAVEDAAREVPDTTQIMFGSGQCKIPAAEYVAKRGFAEWVPWIRQIRSAPDGTIWVSRRPQLPDESHTDVFSASGEYLGTLPPDFKFPTAFLPNGDLLYNDRDELDVERIQVYRVVRD